MRELFRERDYTRVGFCRSLLESNGIPAVIRNENLSGLTEIPIPDFFPALFVVNDEDYPRAIALLRELLAVEEVRSLEEIPCPACGEASPGNFEVCWNCGGAMGE